MSVYFYAKLRSNSGLKGPRGDPGEQGPKGSNGSCIITPNCGIVNCRDLIEKEIEKRITVYKNVRNDIKNGNFLKSDQKKILRKINTFIDILIPVCESGKMTKDLAILIHNENLTENDYLSTQKFLNEIKLNLDQKLS